MSKAYRDGWEHVFGPKAAPKITRHPFPLRRSMVVNVELPHDLCLRDLRRFVQYLATMCDDWGPEMGLPGLAFAPPAPTCHCGKPGARFVSRDCLGTDHASRNLGSPLCADHCCIECDLRPCAVAPTTTKQADWQTTE